MHLELADGSKIKSTQQTQFTQCTVGEASSLIRFTITKLLSNVDIVLGMDWLARWNPVIDWRRQVMHLYVNRHWTQVHGVLLDGTQQVGTVKILDAYRVSEEKTLPDWIVAKQPMLWDMEKKNVQKMGKLPTNESMSKNKTARFREYCNSFRSQISEAK